MRNANKECIYQKEPAHKKVPVRHFPPAVPEWLKMDCRMVHLKNPASTIHTKIEYLT